MESLWSIFKVPLGVFGLGSGLGCGLGFAFRKPQGGAFNILPRESIENLPRGSIHHYTPSAFPQIVPLYLTPCLMLHYGVWCVVPL